MSLNLYFPNDFGHFKSTVCYRTYWQRGLTFYVICNIDLKRVQRATSIDIKLSLHREKFMSHTPNVVLKSEHVILGAASFGLHSQKFISHSNKCILNTGTFILHEETVISHTEKFVSHKKVSAYPEKHISQTEKRISNTDHFISHADMSMFTQKSLMRAQTGSFCTYQRSFHR